MMLQSNSHQFVTYQVDMTRQVLILTAVLAISLTNSSRSMAEMRYEGVKFFVHNTERPGTARLYRLLLEDGSHLYTTNKKEVDSLVGKDVEPAVVEKMDAYVYNEKTPKTVRLYRFTQALPNNVRRHFFTAFEPEVKEVAKQSNSRLHSMKSFVFPHTYRPVPDEGVVPVHSFYNEESGEHFYTTSEDEMRSIIKIIKRLQASK